MLEQPPAISYDFLRMMKKIIALLTVALALSACCNTQTTCPENGNCASASACKATAPVKPRKVALQMWSLHKMPLEEALKVAHELGFKYVELYPGQQITAANPDKLWASASPEQIELVKKLLKDNDLQAVSFGVMWAKDDNEIERACKFANALGIKRLITEATVATFPSWDRIGAKYGVTMCLHHHAYTSSNQYYDADLVNKYTRKYKFVMANPDIGHLARCGINPVCNLKKLEGNIGSIHVKSEKEFNKLESRCLPLGEGVVDMKAVLAELDRQGYDGFYVVEYEADWDNNKAQIKKCLDYLNAN